MPSKCAERASVVVDQRNLWVPRGRKRARARWGGHEAPPYLPYFENQLQNLVNTAQAPFALLKESYHVDQLRH
eukprot:scaffold75883_cov31-Tisochrysis_lutea.AAC.2